MRESARSLIVIATLFLVASCAHMRVPAAGSPPAPLPAIESLGPSPCPNANHTNPGGPVICIDDSSMNADPEHQKVKQGAWVHFFFANAANKLDINFDDPSLVELKGCSGFACWVRVRDGAKTGPATYKARNLTLGTVSKDPEIEIVP